MSAGLQVDFAQAKIAICDLAVRKGGEFSAICDLAVRKGEEYSDTSGLSSKRRNEISEEGALSSKKGEEEGIQSVSEGDGVKILEGRRKVVAGSLDDSQEDSTIGEKTKEGIALSGEEKTIGEGTALSGEEKTVAGKLAKGSVFEALRPPVRILPEGDHGYGEGMPHYVAEPREEKSQEVLRPTMLQSPIAEKKASETQTDTQETSTTESDRSEPRVVLALIETVQGLQRELQVLAEGIKRKVRSKKWAQKAHARRERRGTARQKDVENQPSQFPAGSPRGLQQDESTADIGKKPAEEGTQSPKDWEPLEVEKVQSTSVEFREDQQLSGCGLADTQTLTPQEGLNR
jgi:hypothetical protein